MTLTDAFDRVVEAIEEGDVPATAAGYLDPGEDEHEFSALLRRLKAEQLIDWVGRDMRTIRLTKEGKALRKRFLMESDATPEADIEKPLYAPERLLRSRPSVVPRKELTGRVMAEEWARIESTPFVDPLLEDTKRPVTRADCEQGIRPCPFVGCKYSTFLDVTEIGSIKYNFGDVPLEDIPAKWSCVLDLAEEGPRTLEEVGAILSLSRERARQLEERIIRKLGDRVQHLKF